jgi:hypothetical protein
MRATMITVKKKSATTMQPGKSTPAVVHCLSVKIVIAQFKHPIAKALGVSLEGTSHDLRKVGSAAS